MAKKSKKSNGADALRLGLADLEQVLFFMQEHGLEEIAYERHGIRIHLRKASGASAGAFRALTAAEIAAATHSQAAAPASAGAVASKERPAEAASAPDVHIVKSPIVGTFYAAPGPEAEPFVSVGKKVDSGQVLCIIEAMKLMNEIESDVAGEVVQILVENGHPVEYGQPLFGIRAKARK
jgi:acetyl-CoA carboxylase biotin carboxyl carrier protein